MQVQGLCICSFFLESSFPQISCGFFPYLLQMLLKCHFLRDYLPTLFKTSPPTLLSIISPASVLFCVFLLHLQSPSDESILGHKYFPDTLQATQLSYFFYEEGRS